MIKILLLIVLLVFYATYLLKAFLLRRQGITVNLLGSGQKSKKAFIFEWVLRVTTVAGALIQLAAPFLVKPASLLVSSLGLILMAVGTLIFILAVITMKNNWRAGFDEQQKTELVTSGIYQYSRNPAFVGFDLLYLGVAIALPSWITFLSAGCALLLFHLQIIGEEGYLINEFGGSYRTYRTKVRRYL